MFRFMFMFSKPNISKEVYVSMFPNSDVLIPNMYCAIFAVSKSFLFQNLSIASASFDDLINFYHKANVYPKANT